MLLGVRIFYTKKKDAVLLYVEGSCLSLFSRKDEMISNGMQIFKTAYPGSALKPSFLHN